MFWKKKKDKEEALPFTIEYDEDQRAYYRVAPRGDEPLFLKTQGKRYRVLDISAGGVAFEGAGFSPGDSVSAVLQMPPGQAAIPLVMTIVKAQPEHIVAGQFTKINEEDRELVHYYVLKRQKEELDNQRRQSKQKKAGQEPSED